MGKILSVWVMLLLAQGAWAGRADNCLKVTHNSSGMNFLENVCNRTVEAAWCKGSDCKPDSQWSIISGAQMPIEGNSSDLINSMACDGANSIKSIDSPNTITCK